MTASDSIFPFPTISPIATIGTTPSYTTLTIAQRELTANAYSVRSADGTGLHGHIVLVTSPADFITLTTSAANPAGVIHAAPNNPGPVLPAFTAALYRTWEADTKTFETYYNTDLALKKQLIAAVPNMYIKAIEHNIYGFALVTTLQILTHLWANYGKIRPADLDINIKKLQTPWFPPTPIEDLFAQMDASIKFADDNNDPLGDQFAIRIGYGIIQKTGLFETACYHWRQLDIAAQTLPAFKIYFAKANLDREVTTSQAGFHAAASVNSNQSDISELSVLSNKFDLLIAALAQAQPKKPAASVDTSSTSSRSTNSGTVTRHRGYCWTHGVTHGIVAHTSANCKHPAIGHQLQATEASPLGGSTKIWAPRPPSV